MEMELADTLQLLFERFSAFQTLWTIYATVVIGVIAYIGASTASSSTTLVRVLLIIVFSVFSIANLETLLQVREQRVNLSVIAKKFVSKSEVVKKNENEEVKRNQNEKVKINENFVKIIENSEPKSRLKIRFFHNLFDVFVIIVIWFVPGEIVRFRTIFETITSLKNKDCVAKESSLEPVAISWLQLQKTWRLERPYEVEINDFILHMDKGFMFDLASIPRPLWVIIAPFELSIVAPLAHDFIYRVGGTLPNDGCVKNKDGKILEGIILSRLDADKILRTLMEIEGVSLWKRSSAYYAVRIFGWINWQKSKI